MIRFSFRKGLAFLNRARKRWTIERTLHNHKLRLESDDGEHEDLTREELTERIVDAWRQKAPKSPTLRPDLHKPVPE